MSTNRLIQRLAVFLLFAVLAVLAVGCDSQSSAYRDASGCSLAPVKIMAIAAAEGDLATVRTLVEEEGIWVAQPTGKKSALHWAASYGHLDVMNYLLDKGISPNITFTNTTACVYHYTPLYEAVNGGRLDAVKLLLSRGAQVDAGLQSGDPRGTPFILAVGYMNLPIARFLLQHGADPNFKTQDGATALTILLLHENAPFEQVVFLVENGVDIYQPFDPVFSMNTYSPLALAGRNNRLDIYRYLVSKGADPAAPIGKGMTAEDYLRNAAAYNYRTKPPVELSVRH